MSKFWGSRHRPSGSRFADFPCNNGEHMGCQPGSHENGLGGETRTPDILLPKQARYQLRYTEKRRNSLASERTA